MKVGIVTYHRSQNYGALLQAYALQTFLKSVGCDAMMVDYWPDYHRQMYMLFSWSKFKKLSFKSKLKYIYTCCFTFIRHRKRERSTGNFIREYLFLDKSFKYDVAVYGSDQIWRKQDLSGGKFYNSVYFADNTIEAPRKISYAGSMGKIEVNSSEDKTFLKEHWSCFNAISVRESDLRNLVENISGINATLVLDPVFLLSKEQWMRLINKSVLPKSQKKFLVYYRLQKLSIADELVEKIAREKGLDVIEFSGYISPFRYGKRYRETSSVIDLLCLIYHAEYVVAAAFHGMAMSLCLEKQFYAFSDMNQSNRLSSLLHLLDIEHRLNVNPKEVDINDNIDYNVVNKHLASLKTNSKNWLLNNL